MAGRETHRRAEVPLTVEERIRLSEARALVAELSEREEPVEQLTEKGYEQRMARMKAMDCAVTVLTHVQVTPVGQVTKVADEFYRYIWEGEVG